VFAVVRVHLALSANGSIFERTLEIDTWQIGGDGKGRRKGWRNTSTTAAVIVTFLKVVVTFKLESFIWSENHNLDTVGSVFPRGQSLVTILLD